MEASGEKIYSSNIQIDSREIKSIRDFIEKKMNISQKNQVIEIIKNSQAKFTMNKNGYFINLNNMPIDMLYKIKMFVDFTRENAKELQKTEDILNEEKSRIEGFDKVDEEVNNFSNFGGEQENEKSINFEIYSLDSVQSEIFDEYREDQDEEIEFVKKMVECDKRENSGYKIILKRYKKKYFGNQAKILKKFRDISRNSINSKSAKTSLTQNTTKPVVKPKVKKIIKKVTIDDTENLDIPNQEETQTGCDEFSDDDEEEDDVGNVDYFD